MNNPTPAEAAAMNARMAAGMEARMGRAEMAGWFSFADGRPSR